VTDDDGKNAPDSSTRSVSAMRRDKERSLALRTPLSSEDAASLLLIL
jgi:hypothetical protein